MTADTPMRRIAALLEYVRTHLDADLNVGVLAERAGFSPFHFQRIFRLAVGQTIGEYLRGRRLQNAAIRLRSSDYSITEIAVDSGYETPSAFGRAFLNTYGVTPSAFRAAADIAPVKDQAMTFTIEHLKPMRLLGMRKTGPYSEVPDLWQTFVPHAAARGLLCDAQLVGLSYDDPDEVDHDSLRYDACVESDGAPDEVLAAIDVAAGRFAIYRHTGPYALIGHLFDRLLDHVVFRAGFEIRNAPFIEIYRNNAEITPQEARITDLAIPII